MSILTPTWNFHRISRLILFLGLLLLGCSAPQPVSPSNIPAAIPVDKTPTSTPPPVSPSSVSLIGTPTAAGCNETSGSVENGVIKTSLLDKPMTYNVYLPPCYTFDKGKRYPVLYLLHGQNYDESQWIRLGATSSMERLIAAGELPPFIIVMPFDYSYKQPSEYNFEQVFVQLLIPQIDRTYRTLVDAPHRAVGGLSRGGAWAIRLGTRHPELFGAIGGHSAAIFYVDEQTLSGRLLKIPASQMPRLWLDMGDSDSEVAVIKPFEQFLTENNIPHELHIYVGWHDEKYWSAHVAEYLRWYAANWTQ